MSPPHEPIQTQAVGPRACALMPRRPCRYLVTHAEMSAPSRQVVMSADGVDAPHAPVRVAHTSELASRKRSRSPKLPISMLPLGSGSTRRVPEAGVLRRKLSDRRPVERLTAVSEERQKPIAEQARQRHRHAKSFRRCQGEPDVLLSQRCGKPRGLEPLLGDLPSIGRRTELPTARHACRQVGTRRGCRREAVTRPAPSDVPGLASNLRHDRKRRVQR